MTFIRYNSSFVQIYLKLKHQHKKGDPIVLVPKANPMTIYRPDNSRMVHYLHDTHMGTATMH